MNSKYYIVNNKRQKEYLYCLGFDYIIQRDKFDETKDIWLFERTDKLLEAIDFYCKFRYTMDINQQMVDINKS